MKNKFEYIAIAGSSGGHILPAIKFINELSNYKNPDTILFITSEVGQRFQDKIINSNINVLEFKTSNKIKFILDILITLFPIFIKNKKLNLIGFGGFLTSPILYFAKIFNLFFFSFNKIYIHEQNYVFGLANKLNYFISHKVFTSFPTTKFLKKEIYVGNFFNDINNFKFTKNEKIKILLLGGSAGSLELNDLLIQKLSHLSKDILDNIQVLVQIPDSFFEEYRSKYLNIIKDVSFFSFKNDLNYLEYDLIISRSGSGSLNDILYITNYVFFIPHMHSRDGHQKLNLDYFKKYNSFMHVFKIPHTKKNIQIFYFNNLINPYSINKIVCYLTR